MAKKKRVAREDLDHDKMDLLLPIDITKLGSDDDPCFGKLHDLSAPECGECGDSDFCSIVKTQNAHKVRLNIENNQRFKDVEEADDVLVKKKEKAKVYITQYKKEGLKRLKTILRVSEELNLPKDIVKQVYDQI